MKVHARWRPHVDWGDAKIASVSDDGAAVSLEYFTLPGIEPRRVEARSTDLLAPGYEKGQRVYFTDESGALRSGRLAEQGLHDSGHVALEYPGPIASGPVLLINATGGGKRSLPPEVVEICSDLEVGDPTPVLAAMANEGSWWFHTRTGLVRSLARERAVFRGLSGLASAAIDINEHQIEVARRVLGDPVSRYILADEVGLGKTIEAAIIIRQHVLESEAEVKALVVVPKHLVGQWRSELAEKFGLGEELVLGSIEICTTSDVQALVEDVWEGQYPEMLVVDEAHHLAAFAFSENGPGRALFKVMGDVSDAASRVLLLSATPVLRDTAGFLAMLHLMDRKAFPLEDLAGFSRKVESREAIAELSFLLSRPVLPLLRKGLLARLEPVVQGDETARSLVSALANDWADDNPRAALYQSKLLGHIRSAHQVYRRLIRTRRDDPSVEGALPKREHEVVEVQSEFHHMVSEFLDDWRLADLATLLESDHKSELSQLFAHWVATSFESPEVFLDAIRTRRISLETTVEPAFSGELALIDRYLPELQRIAAQADAQISEVLSAYGRGNRVVAFLSDSSLCEQVSERLGSRASVVEGDLPDADVLLVPRAGEEGLNLQRLKADLVHADVPLSTVRIEQRIGRMDRLNAANLTVHSRVLCVPGTYQGDWVSAVTSAAQVFFASVSSLQYMIADAESLLRRELLEHGRDAFDRFAQGLVSSDGPFSLEREQKRLRSQDTLDAARLEGGAAMFQAIDDYEFDDYEETIGAITRWTVDGLRFQPYDAHGQAFDLSFDPSKPHRLRLTDKHMTRSQLRRWFGSALDRRTNGLPANLKGSATVVSAGDRNRALSAGASLLRIGHPLVTGVQRMLAADDRGRTFAMQSHGTADRLEPVFRFDLRLEGRLVDESPTLARRLEELLPPLYVSVWVDSEGNVLDSDDAAECEASLVAPDTKSVFGPENWDAILDKLEAHWPTLVLGVRDTAVKEAMAGEEWIAGLDRAKDRLAALRADLESTLKARQSSDQGDTESDLWGREFFFLDQLQEMIDLAGPRVEAAGVLFRRIELPG